MQFLKGPIRAKLNSKYLQATICSWSSLCIGEGHPVSTKGQELNVSHKADGIRYPLSSNVASKENELVSVGLRGVCWPFCFHSFVQICRAFEKFALAQIHNLILQSYHCPIVWLPGTSHRL